MATPTPHSAHADSRSPDPAVDPEAIRQAIIAAAIDAYQDGGLAGMCAEGRWELAVDAMRRLDLDSLPGGTPKPHPGS